VSTPTTYAEVVAAVGATIAAYTHALDDGRTDDVVATFCADGGCDIPGLGTFEGHDALREAYTGWTPKQPMRHLVVNTHVTEWSDAQAKATSDVIVLVKGESSWTIAVVGRYDDTLHHNDGKWRFHHRAATFVT
jgi:hypothetical protein